MSFTPVGSLGDVIALITIVKDLVNAFDKRTGSSADYQEIIRKLWAFNRVLEEVDTLCRSIATTDGSNTSRDAMLSVVGQARNSIEALSKGIRKFEPSLREGGSRSSLQDAARKAQWRLFHSDDSNRLQSEIDTYCSIFGVLITMVNERHRTKLRDERLYRRIEINDDGQREHALLLNNISGQVQENNKQVRAGNTAISKIVGSVNIEWIRSFNVDIKRLLQNILLTASATYKVILDIQGRLPSHLERRLYQEPFILEDAHKRVKPVYMDCISSWEAFDVWLEFQFRDLPGPGHSMVQNQHYVLHESDRNRDIQRRCSWEHAFLPGQKIVMCMLFQERFDSLDSPCCPKCFLESPVTEADTEWCGTWYRRKTESTPSETQMSEAKIESSHKTDPAGSRNTVDSQKRIVSLLEYDEKVCSFKRVRLLSKTPLRGAPVPPSNRVHNHNSNLGRWGSISRSAVTPFSLAPVPLAIPNVGYDPAPPPLPPPRYIDEIAAGGDHGWAWGNDPSVTSVERRELSLMAESNLSRSLDTILEK